MTQLTFNQRADLRTSAALVAALSVGAILPGCVARERVIVREQPAVDERPLGRAMPAAIHHDRGSAPAAGFSGVAGHSVWRFDANGGWVWVWVWVEAGWRSRARAVPEPAAMNRSR